MRFSLATTILAAASTAQALAVPQIQSAADIRSLDASLITTDNIETSIETSASIEKRAVLTTILTAATSAVVSAAAKAAVEAAIALIQNLSDWTNARETFTKTTAYTMLVNNPDASYVAAICNNQAYTLLNSLHSEITSVELELGSLSTDYDCFYMQAGNTFYQGGEGGYINVAKYWYTGLCTSDSVTGDLVC